MLRFGIVCAGGAIGTGVRYLVGLWATERFGPSFPYGTMIVNLSGCFLIAIIMTLVLRLASFPPDLRFFLVTGVMGGLTTYSSFNYETAKLVEDGAVGSAALNVAVTLFGCAIAGVLGLAIARRFV